MPAQITVQSLAGEHGVLGDGKATFEICLEQKLYETNQGTVQHVRLFAEGPWVWPPEPRQNLVRASQARASVRLYAGSSLVPWRLRPFGRFTTITEDGLCTLSASSSPNTTEFTRVMTGQGGFVSPPIGRTDPPFKL